MTTADTGAIFGRGLAFPPRVGADGRVAWSQGPLNVQESIRIILMTGLRERLRLPQFGAGLSTFLFEPNTVGTRRLIQESIIRALTRWEPRIRLESVAVEPDPADPRAAVATITYRLIATQSRERVSLTVAVGS